MAIIQTKEPPSRKTLRLWPGIVALVLQWLVWFIVPIVAPEAAYLAIIGGVLGGLAVGVWWVFFSRVPRAERWGALVLMLAAMAVTSQILHMSIATGMMGFMF